MKLYTTPEQTAKLIELGFERPRIDAGVTNGRVMSLCALGAILLASCFRFCLNP